jgi:hypothetical protein
MQSLHHGRQRNLERQKENASGGLPGKSPPVKQKPNNFKDQPQGPYHNKLISPSSTSPVQGTFLRSQPQSTGHPADGFQLLTYSQSIEHLPNGFKRILSFRSQSIAHLANGLGRILDSQTRSVRQLPNGLQDALYVKHTILEAAVTHAVCRDVEIRIARPKN